MTGPGQTGVTGTSAPRPVEGGHSSESDCVMSRSLVTEAGTVGRTSVRVEAVTQILVSVSCFGTFITLFNIKRLAVKSIDSGIRIVINM